MSLSEQLLPPVDQMLGALDAILAKAAADPRADSLLVARLTDDMHPLATQVRFTCNQAVTAVQRLSGTKFAQDEADDLTIHAARQRIAATRSWIAEIDRTTLGAEDAPVDFDLPNGMAFAMTAMEYVRDWAMPQFYFHMVAAYAILRSQGIPLGKVDYVPFMMRYRKVPTPA
jgi:uncharacterized protein